MAKDKKCPLKVCNLDFVCKNCKNYLCDDNEIEMLDIKTKNFIQKVFNEANQNDGKGGISTPADV